jgi:hypothetical protein
LFHRREVHWSSPNEQEFHHDKSGNLSQQSADKERISNTSNDNSSSLNFSFIRMNLHLPFPIDCSILIRRTNDNFKWKMSRNFICYSHRSQHFKEERFLLHVEHLCNEEEMFNKEFFASDRTMGRSFQFSSLLIKTRREIFQ